jgi:hypothetical protein
MAAVTKIGPSTPIQRRHAGDQPRFGSPTHRVAHTQHARIKKNPPASATTGSQADFFSSAAAAAVFLAARYLCSRATSRPERGHPGALGASPLLPRSLARRLSHSRAPWDVLRLASCSHSRTAAGGVPAQPASLAHAHCGGGSPDALAPAYLQPRSPDDLQQATSRAIFSVSTWTRSTGRKP